MRKRAQLDRSILMCVTVTKAFCCLLEGADHVLRESWECELWTIKTFSGEILSSNYYVKFFVESLEKSNSTANQRHSILPTEVESTLSGTGIKPWFIAEDFCYTFKHKVEIKTSIFWPQVYIISHLSCTIMFSVVQSNPNHIENKIPINTVHRISHSFCFSFMKILWGYFQFTFVKRNSQKILLFLSHWILLRIMYWFCIWGNWLSTLWTHKIISSILMFFSYSF